MIFHSSLQGVIGSGIFHLYLLAYSSLTFAVALGYVRCSNTPWSLPCRSLPENSSPESVKYGPSFNSEFLITYIYQILKKILIATGGGGEGDDGKTDEVDGNNRLIRNIWVWASSGACRFDKEVCVLQNQWGCERADMTEPIELELNLNIVVLRNCS